VVVGGHEPTELRSVRADLTDHDPCAIVSRNPYGVGVGGRVGAIRLVRLSPAWGVFRKLLVTPIHLFLIYVW